ncbi:MAG: hypothetical protein KF805_07570 [Phycisphaeraceae bacterium]|nr:hypothetical protein [Phycisphaeraceae bacterium]
MSAFRILQRVVFLTAGLIWLAMSAIGCLSAETASYASAMGSAYVSTPPLRAEQIVLRGPLTVYQRAGALVDPTSAVPMTIEDLNEWARQHFAGATVDLVSYAPQLTVRGENFDMNFQSRGSVVLNLRRSDGSWGQWSIGPGSASEAMMDRLRATRASVAP